MPTLLGLGMSLAFSNCGFKLSGFVGNVFPGKLVGASSAGEIEGNDVVCGSVTDGTFVISSDINGLLDVSSGSCIEVCKSAAVVKPDDCHGSSCNVASTVVVEVKRKEKIQFFVNYGKGSAVVRCSPHSMVSHVVQYGSEKYAVCVPGLLNRTTPCLGMALRMG